MWKNRFLWSSAIRPKRRPIRLLRLGALRSGTCGTIESSINNSKGCGGVMRFAPVGLSGVTDVFRTGCELAAITHGHPSGYLAAGFLSQIICDLFNGGDLRNAIAHALALLRKWSGHEECTAAVERAVCLAETKNPSPEKVERLGAGWVAEEALAISLYCALVATDFASGVCSAVTPAPYGA